MLEPASALLQWPVTGLVLGTVDVVPDQTGPMGVLLVDADDAVAGVF